MNYDQYMAKAAKRMQVITVKHIDRIIISVITGKPIKWPKPSKRRLHGLTLWVD